jgi:hypothetical protein
MLVLAFLIIAMEVPGAQKEVDIIRAKISKMVRNSITGLPILGPPVPIIDSHRMGRV